MFGGIIFDLAGPYMCLFRTNVHFSLGAKRLFFILACCKPFLRVVFSLIYLFEFSNTFGRFQFYARLTSNTSCQVPITEKNNNQNAHT